MTDPTLSLLLSGQPRFSAFGELPGAPVRNFFMTGAVDLLARGRTQPLRILEIGAWVGASAASWSEALDRFHPPGGSIVCVDPWTPYPIENDFHPEAFLAQYRQALESDLAYRLFRHNVGLLNHPVVAIRSKSTDALPLLQQGAFDLVYIDGDHTYDSCRFDIEQGRRLVAPGGLLCGDDLDLTLAEADRAFVEANRQKQPAVDPQGRNFHPGVTLAVGEAFAEVGNFLGFWGVKRTATGFAPMVLDGARGFVPSFFNAAAREEVRRALGAWSERMQPGSAPAQPAAR
ncbi:MAG: class I SAM-dependent methyltransferase [Sneathiellaceae bacterium]